jgi:hypothetical protein
MIRLGGLFVFNSNFLHTKEPNLSEGKWPHSFDRPPPPCAGGDTLAVKATINAAAKGFIKAPGRNPDPHPSRSEPLVSSLTGLSEAT